MRDSVPSARYSCGESGSSLLIESYSTDSMIKVVGSSRSLTVPITTSNCLASRAEWPSFCAIYWRGSNLSMPMVLNYYEIMSVNHVTFLLHFNINFVQIL